MEELDFVLDDPLLLSGRTDDNTTRRVGGGDVILVDVGGGK